MDIWHDDAYGHYSDVNNNGYDATGHDFLRGYQVTNSSGVVSFTTIYPGWYTGRTVHIHFKNKSGDVGGAVFAASTPGDADQASDLLLSSFNNTMSGNKSKSQLGAVFAAAIPNNNPLFNNADLSFHSRNDIVFGNDGTLDFTISVEGTTTATSDLDYGLFGGRGSIGPVTIVLGANLSTGVDPLVVKRGKDVHLQPTSPAIDTGTCSGAPATDFDGEARPKGVTCDIGADEF